MHINGDQIILILNIGIISVERKSVHIGSNEVMLHETAAIVRNIIKITCSDCER